MFAETSLPPGKGAGPRQGPITKLSVEVPTRGDVDRLAVGGYDLGAVLSGRAVLFVDGDELANLRAAGCKLTVLESTSADWRSPTGLGDYNAYTAMTAMLDDFATNYPAICRKFSIGKSVQGRDLWALKITSQPDVEGDKPRFKYVATMHGDEPMGTEMCLYFINRLLTGYTSNDTRIVNLVQNVETWVLPLMNPDGRSSTPPQRYNAKGYDLNRSFPEGSVFNLGNVLYGPAMNTNGLQPEVAHIMTWTKAHGFTLSANYHMGTKVVNYPYDNDGLGSVFSPSPDEDLLRVMSLTYASNNLPMWNSLEFPNGVVNGAAWYAVNGGMQDWNYRHAGCMEVTIEIADFMWPDPPATEIPTYWSQNQESMLSYLEWSLRGVRGVLRDARSGNPVAGAIRVEGNPHLAFSHPRAGDYHRILLPGVYALTFTAPGYVAQRVTNVIVGSSAATRVDVALEPAGPQFSAKINFQTASATVPTGFAIDTGAAFGVRANGLSYGWEAALPAGAVAKRNAGRSQDPRFDAFAQMQAGGNHTWEIAVPPGPYSVLLSAGDPAQTNGLYRIAVEDLVLLDGAPSASNRWVEGFGTVVVTDGRLTISNGPGAISNRLNHVELSAVEPATIAQWRARHFATITNAGAAANLADSDGDGLANLFEYAFGTNPNQPDALSLPQPVTRQTNSAAWFGCAFPRNANATDLSMRVQVATDLGAGDWSDLATFSSGSGWSGPAVVEEARTGGNTFAVTVLHPQPLAGASRAFLRLWIGVP